MRPLLLLLFALMLTGRSANAAFHVVQLTKPVFYTLPPQESGKAPSRRQTILHPPANTVAVIYALSPFLDGSDKEHVGTNLFEEMRRKVTFHVTIEDMLEKRDGLRPVDLGIYIDAYRLPAKDDENAARFLSGKTFRSLPDGTEEQFKGGRVTVRMKKDGQEHALRIGLSNPTDYRMAQLVFEAIAIVEDEDSVTGKPAYIDSSTFTFVEQMPEFPGDISQFLSENIKYPSRARDSSIQARLTMTFVVREDGNVEDIKVARKKETDAKGRTVQKQDYYGFEQEAIRVIRTMPPWKPGKRNGQPVKTSYTLPITFSLD